MFKFFMGNVLLALGMFSVAQYRGWSVMPTTAEEYQRQKADRIAQATRPTWSGGGGSGGGFRGK